MHILSISGLVFTVGSEHTSSVSERFNKYFNLHKILDLNCNIPCIFFNVEGMSFPQVQVQKLSGISWVQGAELRSLQAPVPQALLLFYDASFFISNMEISRGIVYH